jgi:hypothetical protein
MGSRLPAERTPVDSEHPPGIDEATGSIVVRARMSADRARRFGQLIEVLAAEFADGASGEGETFGFVGGVYVPDWSRPREAG